MKCKKEEEAPVYPVREYTSRLVDRTGDSDQLRSKEEKEEIEVRL